MVEVGHLRCSLMDDKVKVPALAMAFLFIVPGGLEISNFSDDFSAR